MVAAKNSNSVGITWKQMSFQGVLVSLGPPTRCEFNIFQFLIELAQQLL